MDRLSGRGGSKQERGGGEIQDGGDVEGGVFLRRAMASFRMEWRRCSWPDMKLAECLSPVQRAMSTQSRDWFSNVLRFDNAGKTKGLFGDSERCVCGRVLRRKWSVFA